MKSKAKENGSGGRLRFGLLLACATVFLLVPTAMASAATGAVEIEGSGSGEVIPIPGEEEAAGSPEINCKYTSPGPVTGTCTTTAFSEEGINVLKVRGIAAPGSSLAEWKVVKGSVLINTCKAGGEVCGATSFGTGEIKLKAVFKKHNVHVSIAGDGAGSLVGAGTTAEKGNPPVNCSYASPGPQTGVCDTLAGIVVGFEAIQVEAKPAPGSQFTGWTVEEGFAISGGCSEETENPLEPTCSALIAEEGEEIKIKATFADNSPKYKLNLSTSGSGSGTLKCDTGSGAGTCQTEYKEGTVVEVLPTANAGSEFVAFSGDCTGGSCEVTMNGEKSVDAQFDLEPRSFTTEQSGEGTVQCSVNAGPLGVCPASALYGDSIKVVASAAEGYTLKSLTGTGSAAGTCNAETGNCEFEITENSGVSASFVTAATIATQEENVHGEVPETTSLSTSCEGDVDLGLFIPGEEKDYEGTCILTATSTGQETELTASDETGVDTGYLTQKLNPVPFPYSLANPLQTKAVNTGGLGGAVGGAFAPLTSPVSLLTFTEPVSADVVTLDFKQHIGKNDPLHTGVYAKTITLTLEQTTP